MSRVRTTVLGLIAALTALTMVALVSTSAEALTRQEKRQALNGVAAKNYQGKATAPVHFRSAKGTFNGVFKPHSFSVNKAGNLVATGELVGKRRLYGHGVRWIDRPGITVPVKTVGGKSVADLATPSAARTAAAAAGCNVLDLVLGPLHLDLLGLNVDLNQVHLNLTAVPGTGLLGDLLCSVANLLQGLNLNSLLGGLLGNLTNLLNQILGGLSL